MYVLRNFSSAVAKSPLAILRKKTGLPIAKCREALVLHADKIEDAEQWLLEQAQKEGWAKVEQLRGRATRQGHIGVLLDERKAALVEVNCETDFVAKNDVFKGVVSHITEALFQYNDKANVKGTTNTIPLTSQAVAGLTTVEGVKMSDLVTNAVGKVAENIQIARGYLVTSTSGMLSSFVYNSTSISGSKVELGSYASVAHLETTNDKIALVQQVGRQLCQQIVGDNPALSAKEHGSSLEALINQPWLLEPSVTVKEVLARHGVSVTDFVRCECGESEN